MSILNKELVMRILTSSSISIDDVTNFVAQYTYSCLDKDISKEEILGIVQAIQMGLFNLRYAAIQAAQKLNLYVMTIVDKNGVLLKTHVYEMP